MAERLRRQIANLDHASSNLVPDSKIRMYTAIKNFIGEIAASSNSAYILFILGGQLVDREALIEEYCKAYLALGRKPHRSEYKIFGLKSQQSYRRVGIKVSSNEFQEILYNLMPRFCRFCDEKLERACINVFCNSSCSAKYTNPLKAKTRYCLHCDVKLKRSSKKYCSVGCQSDYEIAEKYEQWINGQDTFSSQVSKKLVTIRDGYCCKICNISEWHGESITLDLDHISGNSEDNTKNNLRLLCPNCHSQTDTYKNKNVGNGRAFRRKRYKDGKSY